MRITRHKAHKALKTFLESLEPQGLAELTIKNYGKDLELFFRWWEQGSKGRKPINLTFTELSQYRDYMVHEKRFRPSTVNRRLKSLRKFCRWGAAQGLWESDLAEGLKAVRNKRRQCPLSLEDAEVHVLLREAGASQQSLSDRNYALVQLFLQTGIRVAECAALLVEDLVIRERSGTLAVLEGKGRTAREIPLNSKARRALQRYLKNRAPIESRDPVFLSTRDGPMSIRAMQRTVTELARRAGIDRLSVSAHTLRHTFSARYLRTHPGKLMALSSLLGHQSLETTALYTRPTQEDLANDLERAGES